MLAAPPTIPLPALPHEQAESRNKLAFHRRDSDLREISDKPRMTGHLLPKLYRLKNAESFRQNALVVAGSPVDQPTPPTPPPKGPLPQTPERVVQTITLIDASTLPEDWPFCKSFMENPRPAPEPPPKRPSRPTSALFLPQEPVSTVVDTVTTRAQSVPAQQRSPVGLLLSTQHLETRRPSGTRIVDNKEPLSAESSQPETSNDQDTLTTNRASSSTASSDGSKVNTITRSSTAPTTFHRASNLLSLRTTPNRVKSAFMAASPRVSVVKSAHAKRHSSRNTGTQEGRIDKSSNAMKRNSTHRLTIADIDDPAPPLSAPKRSVSPKPVDFVASVLRPESPLERRRRRGETMSMLLDAGFFPVEELIYGSHKAKRPNSMAKYRINLPPQLDVLGKVVTGTGGDAAPTILTEPLDPPTKPVLAKRTINNGSKRSPLSQLHKVDFISIVSSNRRGSEQSSLGGLEAIPEDEDSGHGSGVTTPRATQIHLPGGSVVTVTPPELTAWQPPVYLHGPIKLPKPAVLPGKSTVASLEPFQEAVDVVYQHALVVPRLVNDEAMVDDICTFMDEFGFDQIAFQGDALIHQGNDPGERPDGMQLAESGVNAADKEAQSCTPTQIHVPLASPVETVVAQGVMRNMGELPPMFAIPIPPAETEESLRARGIARRQHGSVGAIRSGSVEQREGSLTEWMPLLPAPEVTMLDSASATVPQVSGLNERRGSAKENHAKVGDGLDETNAGAAWTELGVVPKAQGSSKGLSSRAIRNPVARMRQLVASATTIL